MICTGFITIFDLQWKVNVDPSIVIILCLSALCTCVSEPYHWAQLFFHRHSGNSYRNHSIDYPIHAETKFSGHVRCVYSKHGCHGHACRNSRQGYNPCARTIGFRTTHRVRFACAKNKGERVCVGGGGCAELADGELLEMCRQPEQEGNQAGLCSHWKIWLFDLERPAPAYPMVMLLQPLHCGVLARRRAAAAAATGGS